MVDAPSNAARPVTPTLLIIPKARRGLQPDDMATIESFVRNPE